jgi:D-alanyl-D-alanine carboxypeptidase/D-alanyl-D-alanine-endopeptidase (penicillin-binding protein 4)
MSPASGLKVVTLAVAAEQLGWDYSYETRMLKLGPSTSGFLDGDLIVSGSGDPSLSLDAGMIFEAWAERLKALGVRSLSGRIIGDDGAFDDETIGHGWMWDDLDQAYSAGVGALQLNVDATIMTVSPGATAGEPATIALASEGSGLTVRSHVVTGAAGGAARIKSRRLPGAAVLDVAGTIPLESTPVQLRVAVANPTLYFVTELKKALVAGGIEVRGEAIDIDDVSDRQRLQDAVPLMVHRSPPLAELADTLMKLSQNQYAETLLKTLGAQSGKATFEAGLQVERDVLQSWGVAPSGLLLADGSGLSRYNLITPQAMVDVLTHVYDDPRLRAPFEAALPVVGVTGTLTGRLTGTAAVGTVRAKSGSMRNVRSISGYMNSGGGEPLVFTLMANNYNIASSEIDRVFDGILMRLAAWQR